MKKMVMQFIKFGMVGALNTFLSYGIYFLFLKLGVYYIVCNFIAFVITVFISFLLNRKFVFAKDKEKGCWWKELLRVYASYAGTSLILSSILLGIQVEFLGIPEEIAPFINLVFTIPINFLLNKFWAFKQEG